MMPLQSLRRIAAENSEEQTFCSQHLYSLPAPSHLFSLRLSFILPSPPPMLFSSFHSFFLVSNSVLPSHFLCLLPPSVPLFSLFPCFHSYLLCTARVLSCKTDLLLASALSPASLALSLYLPFPPFFGSHHSLLSTSYHICCPLTPHTCLHISVICCFFWHSHLHMTMVPNSHVSHYNLHLNNICYFKQAKQICAVQILGECVRMVRKWKVKNC